MDFYRQVESITEKDARYKPDAYEFVLHALWFTQHKLKRKGHVSGPELLEGIREFGLDRYGPMTKDLLEHWGVRSTEDFGRIVFNMIDGNLMRKTEGDRLEDFRDVYDFGKAFDVFGTEKP